MEITERHRQAIAELAEVNSPVGNYARAVLVANRIYTPEWCARQQPWWRRVQNRLRAYIDSVK